MRVVQSYANYDPLSKISIKKTKMWVLFRHFDVEIMTNCSNVLVQTNYGYKSLSSQQSL